MIRKEKRNFTAVNIHAAMRRFQAKRQFHVTKITFYSASRILDKNNIFFHFLQTIEFNFLVLRKKVH